MESGTHMMMSPDELIPWEKNPRVNDHAVQAVADSITEFGFASPIIVRKENSMIICGHTRWKASQLLDIKKVPCIVMDLDERTAERLAIADNQVGGLADWDEKQLVQILLGFDEEDFAGIGFDQNDLERMLGFPEDPKSFEPPPQTESDFKFTLMKGDCLERLKDLESESIDSIVTDPPYEIGFMGKNWDDSGIAFNVELWKECWRVLKPGGHMIAFSATRTVHPMGVAISEAGFEIRDMIAWLYFSGFPKSHDVSKGIDQHLGADREVVGIDRRYNEPSGIVNVGQGERVLIDRKITKPATPEAARYQGWGTALKPSYEPAVLARKPLEKNMSVAENVLKHGTGAINIEACRFAYGDPCWVGQQEELGTMKGSFSPGNPGMIYGKLDYNKDELWSPSNLGRWPANIYQCPKAQRSERELGLKHLTERKRMPHLEEVEADWNGTHNAYLCGGATEIKNFHPTVKPLGIMRWLCRLITPPNGIILDPFLGSGTTAVAACLENMDQCIGIEMTEDYFEIIEGRIEWAKRVKEGLEEYDENKL